MSILSILRFRVGFSMLRSDLLKLPVFSLTSREQIGVIKDIVIDDIDGRLLGLLILGKRLLVPWENIERIGSIGVFVTGDDDICFLDKDLFESLGKGEDYINRRVMNRVGEEIGLIRDLLIREGYVNQVLISQGVLADILEGTTREQYSNCYSLTADTFMLWH